MALPPLKLEQAELQEIWWTDKGALQETGPQGTKGAKFAVQFNPQTLKVNFSNQKAGGDQPKGSSTQFVGKGVTKLTLELWFDITVAQAQGRLGSQSQTAGTEGSKQATIDVRSLTQQVAYFMKPQPVKGKKDTFVPPGIRFHWGTFLFEGVMDSMDETLDLFSADGLPIRASVNISLSRQEIIFDPKKNAALSEAPGVQPFEVMKAGEPLQQAAAKAGADWRQAALANGIENPRLMSPGALVNLSAGVSVGAAAQLGVDVSGGVQIGGGIQGGAGAGFSAGFSTGLSAGVSAQSVAGGGAQFSAGSVAGVSVQGGVSGGVQAQGGISGSLVAGGGFGGGV